MKNNIMNQLETIGNLVTLINKATNSPTTYSVKGKHVVLNFRVERYGYGDWTLERCTADHGSVRTYCSGKTKREIIEKMKIFLAGIEFSNK